MNLPHYEASPDSPKFSGADTGLRVAFAGRSQRTIFAANAPWALFGSYRLNAEAQAEFGQRADAYILLVVTHKESKAIYTCRVLRDDLPPKNVPDVADQGGQELSTTGYFAVDLKAQCRMAERPGKYWVAAMLGQSSAPLLEFEIR